MAVDIKILESLDLFADLGSESLARFADCMNRVKVTEGEKLTQMGNFASDFFVILEGNFMIYFENDRALTLHERGEVMGWSTLTTPFQYVGTVVALSKGETLTLAGSDFLDIIRQDASVGDNIMKKLNKTISKRTAILRMA